MITLIALNARWLFRAILLLGFAAVAFAASQQPALVKGEIGGTVLRAAGRRPIQTATVRLLDFADESVIESKMTGDDGVFRFEGLLPGAYVIEISAQGFAKRRYLTSPKTKRPFQITSGGDKIQFEAELHLLARIAGRVIDEHGDGIVGAVIWALANVVATERGLEWRQMTVAGGTGTDTEGNFVISNLLPGEYYLYATPAQGSQPGEGLAALPPGAKRVMDGYYPQARSIEEARPVFVLASESLTDLRIQLAASPSYCAHGTITNGNPSSNGFWYAGAFPDRTSRVTRNPISTTRLSSSAKDLTLCGLPQEPLVVELFGPAPGGVAGRAMITPRKDGNTEFRLDLSTTFSIEINARLDSETARWCQSTELPSAGCYGTGAIRFNLKSPYTYVFMNPRASKVAPGSLTLDTVFPSAYRAVLQLPAGLFLKKAQLGMQSFTPEEATLLDGASRTLDLTIGESQAKLRIELSGAKDFAGTVYLVPIGPDAQYSRQIVSVPILPGESRAETKGLAPGDYDVIPVRGDDPAAAIAVLRNGTGFQRVHIELNGVASISLKP
jgi:hypothetical protein